MYSVLFLQEVAQKEYQEKIIAYNKRVSSWIQDRKGGRFVKLIQEFWRHPLIIQK